MPGRSKASPTVVTCLRQSGDDANKKKAISTNKVVAALIAVAVCSRFTWNAIRQGSGATGEAAAVAHAIATGRGFADAYQVGQGPTAHLLPISPGIAGAVYGLFGVHSAAAEMILAAWAAVLMVGTYLLIFRLFGRMGVPLWARTGSLAYLCIAPTYIPQEAVDFRIWEGGLATFLGSALLYAVVTSDLTGRVSRRSILAVALLSALLFFVNPVVGLGGYACVLLLALRRWNWRHIVAGISITAGALLMMVGPWTLRNATALGSFIPLRSNAGLELAIAEHPRAVASGNDAETFRQRLKEIHPAVSEAAFRRMQSMGGEVAYSAALGAEAKTWIAHHPDAALELSGRHLRQTFLPEPWQFGTGLFPSLRALLASISGVGGLLGLALGLAKGRPGWKYVGAMVLVPALAMSPFQPVPRYTYLYYPWLTLCAGGLCAWLWHRWKPSPS